MIPYDSKGKGACMGGARLQGLLRYISEKKYQETIHAKEDKKKKGNREKKARMICKG